DDAVVVGGSGRQAREGGAGRMSRVVGSDRGALRRARAVGGGRSVVEVVGGGAELGIDLGTYDRRGLRYRRDRKPFYDRRAGSREGLIGPDRVAREVRRADPEVIGGSRREPGDFGAARVDFAVGRGRPARVGLRAVGRGRPVLKAVYGGPEAGVYRR